MIGSIGVSPEPHVHDAFDPAHGAQGHVREAVAAFVAAETGAFAPARPGALLLVGNPASARVPEHNGCICTGQGTLVSRARLEPAPVFLYERRQSSKASP